MALLMLLSSTGFSMDMHFCQDQLKGISLIGKAKSCHDEPSNTSCHKTKKTCHPANDNLSQTEKDNCCRNETVVFDKTGLDATSTQITTLQDVQLDFVAAFVAVYIQSYNVHADFQPYAQYKSPLPDRDIQVLYQTFLI